MLGFTSWYRLLVLSVVFFYLHTCPYYYSIIFYLQFIMLLLCTHCLYAQASSFFLTHLLGRFLMTLHLHVQIGFFISMIRCSLRSYISQGPGVSLYLILIFLLLLYSYYFLILLYHYQLPFHLFIYLSSYVDIYMCIYSDCDLLQFIFITCLGYLRLSAYTRGIILTYMRHRLSSCLRSIVFWETGRDREALCLH